MFGLKKLNPEHVYWERPFSSQSWKFKNEKKFVLFVLILMTYLCQITILVAAKGAHKLPNIYGDEDMKKALQKLRTVLSSNLLVWYH